MILQTAPVRPTGVSSHIVFRCVGHIDRSGEGFGDNAAGVVKSMASNVRFLAMPAIARIRLIWQNWRQIFRSPFLTQDLPS